MNRNEELLFKSVIDDDYIFFKLHENEYKPTLKQRIKRLFWKKIKIANINTDVKKVM